MKPDQIYSELKQMAERLGISVEEHNFRATGVTTRGGSCIVRGKPVILIDKHRPLQRKIRILASSLAEFPHEEIYTVPAIRELIQKYAEDDLESRG